MPFPNSPLSLLLMKQILLKENCEIPFGSMSAEGNMSKERETLELLFKHKGILVKGKALY